ncbi:MAG: cation transporter [Bacteroidia bacterium]|jgi:copper chaperone CopZ|nr:cation transporter [Bacteroidia bacterium]
MKTTLVLVCMVMMINITATHAQTSSDSVTYTKDGLVIAKIKTSAVCDMCKETLEKAMAYEKGVKSSELIVETKILTVTFDPKKTSLDKIRLAISNSGYDADQVLANPKSYGNLPACCKKDGSHE